MANGKLHPQDVDVEDILYRFTLAHLEAGYVSPVKNVPGKVRGIDKASGITRASAVARNLHVQYISYINNYVFPKKIKLPKKLEQFRGLVVKVDTTREGVHI